MLSRGNLLARSALVALTAGLAGPSSGGLLGASTADPLPTPGEIAERLRTVPAPAAGLAQARAEVLDLILGGRPYPGRCATPLILSLQKARPSLGPSGANILRRLGPSDAGVPLLAASQPHPSPGSFRLRAGPSPGKPLLDQEDGNLDGVPDEASRLLERLEVARREVLGAFEQTATPTSRPDGDEPIHDVEIAELPDGLAGYVWSGGGPPVLVLDSRRLGGPEGDALLRHLIAHAFQLSLTSEEAPWWYESHAVWAEDPRGLRAGSRAGAVSAYLGASARGLGPERIEAWEGSFLWPHFLIASGPQAVLGAAWEEMAAVPGDNTLQAMETAVERVRGTDLQEEVRAFRIWNVFLGEMDDGRHYPFAAELRPPAAGEPREEPVAWGGSGPLAPLGGEVLQLTADPAPGGWRLRFEGDPRAEWDVTLLTLPAWLGEGAGLASLDVIDGLAAGAVPWRDLSGLFVVVQNLSSERDAGASFRLDVSYDALVPFDLMSFSAEDEGGGTVALLWNTEREMDMLGWRILRSPDPYSGFEPIHALLVPAMGGPEGTSYMFLDQSLQPGRKYYYLLEGITQLGFREVTYPVGVRLSKNPN